MDAELIRLQKRIRNTLWFFIAALIISGLTAFPLVWEINLLARLLHIDPALPPAAYTDFLRRWIALVRLGVTETDQKFPFLAYGTDWLAFGHIVIALFFFGPLREPVRNVFILRGGLAACALVIPVALVCGPLRGIPVFWQIVDAMFGIIGGATLLFCLRDVNRLEALTAPVIPRQDGQ